MGKTVLSEWIENGAFTNPHFLTDNKNLFPMFSLGIEPSTRDWHVTTCVLTVLLRITVDLINYMAVKVHPHSIGQA